MNILLLIAALIVVESNGNNNAIGDGGLAVGCLQIHQCVIDDVNRVYGTAYKPDDRLDRVKSIKIAELYLIYWGQIYRQRTGKQPDYEVYARIWNGGPFGWTKPATWHYWRRVACVLEGAEK